MTLTPGLHLSAKSLYLSRDFTVLKKGKLHEELFTRNPERMETALAAAADFICGQCVFSGVDNFSRNVSLLV